MWFTNLLQLYTVILQGRIYHMKVVVKRDGTEVSFNVNKIKTAILNAMLETKDGIDEKLADNISQSIAKHVDRTVGRSMLKIQDLVEDHLMASERKDVAKKFIIYRYERDRTREMQESVGMAELFLTNMSAGLNMLRLDESTGKLCVLYDLF